MSDDSPPECPQCESDDTVTRGPFFGCNECGLLLGRADVIAALDADPDSPVNATRDFGPYDLEADDE